MRGRPTISEGTIPQVQPVVRPRAQVRQIEAHEHLRKEGTVDATIMLVGYVNLTVET